MGTLLNFKFIFQNCDTFSKRMASRLKLLAPNQLIAQIVRQKGGVANRRKPRWVPVAKSKEFKLPPEDHFPQAEFDQLYLLKFQHRDRIAAISQVLCIPSQRSSHTHHFSGSC